MSPSKTGGGVGTNQYGVRGHSKRTPNFTTPQSGLNLLAQAQTSPSAPDASPPLVRSVVSRRRNEGATRIYVDITGRDQVQPPNGPLCRKPGCQCRGREVDHAVWRSYRRQAIAQLRQVAVAAGLGDHQIKYSTKAGCSCGCSPGFVSDHWGEQINVSAIVGEPGPSGTAVLLEFPDIDGETLIQLYREATEDYERQTLMRHPNFPPQVKALASLTAR